MQIFRSSSLIALRIQYSLFESCMNGPYLTFFKPPQKEYKKALEHEIKGKGMLALANDTPDFMRARNATEILSQVSGWMICRPDERSYGTFRPKFALPALPVMLSMFVDAP